MGRIKKMKQIKLLSCLLFYQAICCFAEPCLFNFTKDIDAELEFSGLSPVDCIYVINLDERPERWKVLKPVLEKQGLNVYRFAAINGWKLSEEVKEKISGPYEVTMCGGHYGCLLSHLSILKDAYERRLQIIWILEDDVEFLHRADAIIPELLSELEEIDPEWDILWTDTNFRNRLGGYTKALAICPRPDQQVFPLSHYVQRPQISKNLYRVFNRYASTSYIVSARGLEKMCNYFNHNYVYSPFDCDIHYIPNLRQYCPGEDYVTNSRFGTTDTQSISELNN